MVRPSRRCPVCTSVVVLARLRAEPDSGRKRRGRPPKEPAPIPVVALRTGGQAR